MESRAELSLLKRLIQSALPLLLFSNLLQAQVYLTRDEALKLSFPQAASVGRKTVFLTDRQVEAIQAKAKAKVESRVVTYYVGKVGGKVDGYAFFETHVVRTMPATFMTIIDPDSSVRSVEILAFYEPEDYLPPKRWLELFKAKRLENDLFLKRGVQNIAGATLSAHAIAEGVRRMLATFEIAVPKEE
ncbi:MAG TPA: FMN-binding protein [Bacteroidota bacterium]|nr:FMN-binding protein [Bacteroidota bacterium]